MTQISKLSTNIPKGVYAIKGDYYFDHHNYVTAINHYSKSLNQNPKDIHATLRIAEAYHALGKVDLAVHWFSKAFSVNPDIEETYILEYIFILNKIEKYDELRHWITIYNDRIGKKNLSNVAHDIYKDSTLLLLHDLQTINSSKSDLGPILYNDKMIFSSNQAVSGDGNYNLYTSVLNPNGQYEEAMPFHEIINSGANEGPMAIATKLNRLFFTRTSQSQGDNKPLMEIFFCDLPADRSDQVKINKLAFKNFNYDIGHPAVNSEGTLMFFTSNNPKHARGFELYRSDYIKKKWSAPKALGAHINTHGDEMYPTLYNDSILYFASNGHGGLGGFDIYKVNLLAKHLKIEHLNAPVNSPSDDFGLIINNDGHEGYLTSNRPGGSGGDDLYKFYILPVKTMGVENMSKPETLSIYASKGDEIKLSGNNKENLVFDFVPGRRYTLLMDYDNYKTGTSKTNSGKTDLPKRNTYAFHIQKSEGVVYEDRNRSARVQDVHINPGDLVTFQLIPNMSLDYEADDSRIRFNKDETKISSNDTIVFSYVAEGDSKIPDVVDTAPIADLNAAGNDDLSTDDKVRADTVSSTPVLAKNTQPGNKTPDADAGKVVETIQPDKLNDKSETDTLSALAALDTIALQNKEPIEQSQPVSKDKNVDPDTVSGNVLEAVQQNKKDLNDPIAMDSLTSAERIAAKENIPDNRSEKNSLSTTKRVDDTSVTKGDQVDKNKAVAKNYQAEDSSQIISPDAIALQNKEPIVQSQSVSKGKNVDPDTVSGNAAETVQQKTKDLNDPIATDSLTSAERIAAKENIPDNRSEKNSLSTTKRADDTSVTKGDQVDKNKAVAKNYQAEDSSQIISPEAVALQNKEPIEQSQPVSKDKNVDSDTVSGNVLEAVQQNIPSPANEYRVRDTRENSDFQYRVQIAASRSELRDAQLKKIYTGSKEIRFFKEDGYYKYYIEETPTYPDAKSVLKESGVENAFIAAYKGDTKWKLNEAITFQKNELIQQTQPGNEDKSIDPITVDGNVAETAGQDKLKDTALVLDIITTNNEKKDPDHPIETNSLISSEGISAQEENILNNKPEKDPVIRTKQADDPITIGYQPSDSLNENNTAVKNNKATDPSQITSPDPKALQDKETIVKDLSGSNDKNVDTNTVSRNAAETIQQKAKDLNDPIATDSLISSTASLRSPSDTHDLAGDTKENNDFQYRVQIAASRSELRNAQLRRIYTGPKEIHFFKEDGYYKYYIEETPDYYIAKRILKESKVDNAFISAYKGNTKWQLPDAIALQYKPIIRSELAKTDSVIKIVTVNFELDEFVLLPKERLHLREYVIDQLKANKVYYAIVNGYTDIRGSEEYNFGLSQERAFFVEQLIINEGINSERVTTQYFGESQVLKYCPENQNCDESVHQANRRVEILLLMNKK